MTRPIVLTGTFTMAVTRACRNMDSACADCRILGPWLVQALGFWHDILRARCGHDDRVGDLIDVAIEAEFSGTALERPLR